MPKKIDVYGLTDAEIETLRKIALKKYGKASVSLLAKKLLQEQLNDSEPCTDGDKHPAVTTKKTRMELRLPTSIRAYLDHTAIEQQMTPNMIVLSILMEYYDRHPVVSNNEAQTLYQSNYQLLRIGRNLNQIARQLNIGENVSITTQHIHELKAVIDAHTERVHQVLKTNRRRFERH